MGVRRSLAAVAAAGCVSVVSGFACSAAPALAGAPEVPVTVSPAGAVTGNTALLEGVLNPHVSAKVSWRFALSNPGGSLCGEGPSVGGGESEGQAVHVSAEATGLQPLRKYLFCVVASNEAGESAQGNEVSFETPPVAPAVDGESVSEITPFQAVMEGQVNPENQETTYQLEYSTKESGGELQQATGAAFGGTPANVFGDQRVGPSVPAAITGLSPATRYYYRVLARNATGETKGRIEEFQTLSAEKPVVENARFVAATTNSETLEAQLNPEYLGVSCEVQYVSEAVFDASGFTAGVSSAGCTTVAPASEFGQGGSPVAFTATLSELQESAAYEYRIVAANGTGTLETAPQRLARTAPQVLETVPGPEASDVTQDTALITPTLNPDVQAPIEASYYVVYGSEPASLEASGHLQAGSGFVPQTTAPVTLTGLKPDTTYYYAVLVSNGNAAVVGTEHQFTTLAAEIPAQAPVVGSESAQYVSEDSVVIEGEINPQGQAAGYEVQYGVSAGYGSLAPASPAELAAVTSSKGVFVGLAGLAPGTTYHYRILASNASGTSYGPDQTFTTAGAQQGTAFTPFAVPSVPQFAIAPYDFPTQTATGTPGKPKVRARGHKRTGAQGVCRRKAKAKRAQCEKPAHEHGPRKPVKSGGKKAER
jgi:phosphodiesterase/alkaline phosphatase D-like protein